MTSSSFALLLKKSFPLSKAYAASDGYEALELLKSKHINIVLLDIGMPRMNGLEVAKKIARTYPAVKILIVTQYHGEALIANLFRIGVDGFVLKNHPTDTIKQAIEQILSGKKFIPENMKERLLFILSSKSASSMNLNKREAEILLLLKMGRSSKEIAQSLRLKVNTINSYREEMLQKTKTKNVAELISFAYDNGILA